jgi:hypothetical protein
MEKMKKETQIPDDQRELWRPPKENEEIFCECGSSEGDEVWKVTQSFQLITKAGPPVVMPVGSLVRLRPETAREVFPFRALPVNLTDPGRYECIEDFRTTNADGCWELIKVGDILELTLAEALPLMRGFKVKPIRGGDKK